MLKDAAEVLSKHAAELSYDAIPAPVLEVAKRSLLDTLGVALAATGTSPALRSILGLIASAGGKPESTAFGCDRKLPAWEAAFVNGALSHALDYDDQHDSYICHPSAPVVTSSLALAERIAPVSGKDLLAAIVIGQDIYLRLVGALHCAPSKNHRALMLGRFAAAAACGRLLGLNAAKMLNAFGIVSCSAGGLQQLSIGYQSELRSMYNAFPARDGLMAALMADAGMGGISGLFDGTFGLLESRFSDHFEREQLLADLGTSFPGASISYKPYPCCRYTHGYIDAVLDLFEEQHLELKEIRKVRVYVGTVVRENCEPRGVRRRPMTTMDAKFSLPFCVGAAMANRRVGIADFEAAALNTPSVLAEVDKVDHVFDPAFEQKNLQMAPAMVEFEVDGATLRKRIEVPHGHPSDPMSESDLQEKFRDCVARSATGLRDDAVSAMIDFTRTIERSDDATHLMTFLI